MKKIFALVAVAAITSFLVTTDSFAQGVTGSQKDAAAPIPGAARLNRLRDQLAEAITQRERALNDLSNATDANHAALRARADKAASDVDHASALLAGYLARRVASPGETSYLQPEVNRSPAGEATPQSPFQRLRSSMSSILASPIGLRQVAASNADPFSCQLLKQAADPMLKITAQQARVECASESRLWLFGQPFVTGSNLERPIAPDILDAAKDPTRLTQQGK